MKKKMAGWTLLTCASFFVAAMAAAGTCATREIEQNGNLRTLDHSCQPGDSAPLAKRGLRAFYVVEGGTLERTYEDGTKETMNYKAGDSRILVDDRAFAYQNIGATPIRFFIVYMK